MWRCADLLSSHSANGGGAFGSYTEMPNPPQGDDGDDFDGFVGGYLDAASNDAAAAAVALSDQPRAASAVLTGQPDQSDETEAVLSSLPDLRFMLDRGRTWPGRGVTVV